MQRMRSLYRSIFAKEPYGSWIFPGKRPATYGFLCIFVNMIRDFDCTMTRSDVLGIYGTMCVYMFAYVYVCMSVCMSVCIYNESNMIIDINCAITRSAVLCIFVCMYVYKCVCVDICPLYFVCMYVYKGVCVYMCVRAYICKSFSVYAQ